MPVLSAAKEGIRILLLEDEAADAELLEYELRKDMPELETQKVYTREHFLNALQDFKPHLILSDFRMPGFGGKDALDIKNSLAPDTPFIFVTGSLGEELAIETLKWGASDLVLKDRMSRLPQAVARAIKEAEEVRERKRMKEELRESHRKMSTLLSNLPGMVYRASNHPDWPMEFVSEGARVLTGYSVTDLIKGKANFGKLILPEFRQEVWESIQEALKLKKPFELVYKIRTAQKTEKWLWEQGQGIFNDLGELEALEGVINDITPQKAAEFKAKQMTEELEGKVNERTAQLRMANKELEAYNYSVSHDLRTPLRAAEIFSNLLQKRYAEKMDEDSRDLMDKLIRCMREMKQLVNDLLAFSLMGRKEKQTVKFEMEELFDECYDMLTADIELRKVSLKKGKMPKPYADRGMIKHVVMNLLSNALKYTRKREETIIEIGGYQTLEEHVFFVKDNGLGFSKEDSRKLFGEFQRLDENVEGMGVGLAIVERIINRHGGQVWAEGEKGKGATFYFSLPRTIQSM